MKYKKQSIFLSGDCSIAGNDVAIYPFGYDGSNCENGESQIREAGFDIFTLKLPLFDYQLGYRLKFPQFRYKREYHVTGHWFLLTLEG